MKDPRIAEIEFLASLERSAGNEMLHIVTSGEEGKRRHFGLSTVAFKSMVFELLLDECLNGSGMLLQQRAPSDMLLNASAQARQQSANALHSLWTENQFPICISHKGRLRLVRLRDEIIERRRREDLGILWAKPHYLDDLAVVLAMREKGSPVSVARFDLDHFKRLNDTKGHDSGDEALVAFMGILKEMTRTVDGGEAYRVGGDEMAVILPAAEHERAVNLAERIRSDTEQHLSAYGVTTSVGVATFRGEVTPEAADRKADELAYKAKEDGRNRVANVEI